MSERLSKTRNVIDELPEVMPLLDPRSLQQHRHITQLAIVNHLALFHQMEHKRALVGLRALKVLASAVRLVNLYILVGRMAELFERSQRLQNGVLALCRPLFELIARPDKHERHDAIEVGARQRHLVLAIEGRHETRRHRLRERDGLSAQDGLLPMTSVGARNLHHTLVDSTGSDRHALNQCA